MNRQRVKTARPIAKLREGRNDWYRFDNRVEFRNEYGGGIGTEVYIYDEIGYWGITADDFVKELNAVDAAKMVLHINSPGGDVFDAIAIYNAIRDHKADVTAVVDGVAASAASFIFMAGDQRVMNRNTKLMIHDAHSICIGNAADMQVMIDDLNQCSDNIASIYAERAGGNVPQWRAAMKEVTNYTADEAVTAGLAHEVNGKSADDSTSNSWDLSIFNRVDRNSAPKPRIELPTPTWALPDLFKEAMKEAMA